MTTEKTVVARKTKFIPLANVIANPNQPRKDFPAEHIRDLANSILAHGLIQPISVRPVTKGAGKTTTYMIIAGECRFRAHQLLAEEGRLEEHVVEAIVSTGVDENDMQILAIIENAKRRDVSPLEEAEAFQLLIDRGYSVADIMRELRFESRNRVVDRLNLLKLTDAGKTLVRGGHLPPSFACEIATLPEHLQTRLIRDISTGKLKTAEQVRSACIALREVLAQGDIFAGAPKASDADLRTLRSMEAKIEDVAKMVSAGFKDGACDVAKKVDPTRTAAMADKLAEIRKHLLAMERQLREASAAASMFEAA